MKAKLIWGMLALLLPVGVAAQEDDMYFTPTKAQKKAEKEQRMRLQREREEELQRLYLLQSRNDYLEAEDYEAEEGEADYHVGKLRNVDEYNRRGAEPYATLVVGEDTTYYTEEEVQEADRKARAQVRCGDASDDLDYGYSGRLVRFHGRLVSPYYWDYYYDWSYDPWLRYGWNYDPWYWDRYYGYGYHSWYGHPWHYPYGWYAGWADPWIDPWFGYPSYSVYPGGWHKPVANRPGTQGALYGGRRAGSGLAGMSSSRGGRGSSTLAGTRSNRYSGSRGSGTYNPNGATTSTGRVSSASRVTRQTSTVGTRQNGTTNSRQTTTVNSRQSTTTRQSTQQNYTPPANTSRSSSGSGFGSSVGSSSRSGGFGGGASSGGARSGGGRGGR